MNLNSLIWIALALFVLWLVIRLVFAVTGLIFHVLWIIAVVLLVIWLVRRIF